MLNPDTHLNTATQDLIAIEASLGAHNYKPLDVILVRGQGVWVWDNEGKRYLDCLSAYSALNQGHCHPKILAAMVEQAKKLTLTSRAFRNDQLALLYEDLAKLTGSHKILPMNSGAEAVESALKAVRKWGYEVKGVPRRGPRSSSAQITFTAARLPSSVSAPTRTRAAIRPVCARLPSRPIWRLRRIRIDHQREHRGVPGRADPGRSRRRHPACRISSPGVRALCSERNVTLILDEIQTGLGRTGKLLAEEHEGIEADVTLIGKALSGGYYPVSAVLSNSEVLGVLKPGQHGSTFGGNPLACAIARTALKVLVEEGMIANAERQGARSSGAAQEHSQPCSPRSTRSRLDACSRIAARGRRRAAVLRKAARLGPAGQGHAREHHPDRAAADCHC